MIATHDLDLARAVCRRVLVLHDGQLQADGDPHTLFADHDLLRRCHLEAPPVSAPATATPGGTGNDGDDAQALSEFAQVLIASRHNISPKRLIEPGPDAAQLDGPVRSGRGGTRSRRDHALALRHRAGGPARAAGARRLRAR